MPSHVCLLSVGALCEDPDIQHGAVQQTKNRCEHHGLGFEFEYPPLPKGGHQVWTRNEVGFASCWIYIYLEEMDEDLLKGEGFPAVFDVVVVAEMLSALSFG